MPKPGLERLEKDLDICVQHLKETGNTETHLEKLFVGLVLSLIYREYERCIRDSIVQRAKRAGDDRLVRFVGLSVKQLGMVSSKLRKNVYKTFDEESKKAQSSTIKDAWKKYDELRDLRNKAVHDEDVSEGLNTILEMHRKASEAVCNIRDIVLGDTKQDPMTYDDYGKIP